METMETPLDPPLAWLIRPCTCPHIQPSILQSVLAEQRLHTLKLLLSTSLAWNIAADGIGTTLPRDNSRSELFPLFPHTHLMMQAD